MTEHNTKHGLLWCAVWLGILAVGVASMLCRAVWLGIFSIGLAFWLCHVVRWIRTK